MNLIILLSIIYLIYFGSIYYHFIIIFAISLILYKFKEAIQNFNKFLKKHNYNYYGYDYEIDLESGENSDVDSCSSVIEEDEFIYHEKDS